MADTTKKPSYFAGVDLGGTKIMTGIFDASLEMIGMAKISTKANRGPEAVMDRIVRSIEDAADDNDLRVEDISAVGIGAPGGVDPKSGEVLFAPNLDWRNVPLKKSLEDRLKIPVFVENDCSVSTMGVYEKEFEGKPTDLIGIFMGTGIGGGFILNRHYYNGFGRSAGEIGHMVIDVNGPPCGCGNRGCFEAFAGRNALFNQIRQAVKGGQKTILTELLGEDLRDLRSGSLRKAIRKGDKFVEKVVTEAARYAGIAVGNLINMLSPQIVVMGGGVIEALEEHMMPVIIQTARRCVLAGTNRDVQIVSSQLADNAGITGAAVLARRHGKKRVDAET